MIAKDILISKSTISTGTAAEVLKGIEAGIVYNGTTRYIHVDMLGEVTGELEMDELDSNVEQDEVYGDIETPVLEADITSSDKE